MLVFFVEPRSLFWDHWCPLFWISGDMSCRFKIRVDLSPVNLRLCTCLGARVLLHELFMAGKTRPKTVQEIYLISAKKFEPYFTVFLCPWHKITFPQMCLDFNDNLSDSPVL